MPVCENSMVKELRMVFFFHTKLHWTQASEKCSYFIPVDNIMLVLQIL